MIVKPEEWITEPDEKEDGLLKVWAASGDTEFPFPVETHHVSLADVTLQKCQAFELILECAAKPDVQGSIIPWRPSPSSLWACFLRPVTPASY